MALPRWDWINPISPDRNLLQGAFNNYDKGLTALTEGIQNYGKAVKDQNTQGILAEAMGINNLADLEEGRRGVLASLAAAGNGADATKVLSTLQQQERALYEKQNNINQLQDREFKLADLAVMRDPDVVTKALSGDDIALDALSRMNDGSPLINAYLSGRTNKEANARDARDFNFRVEGRNYDREQDRFNNNLRTEAANLSLAKELNPDPGGQTTSYVTNPDGTMTEVITENPSLASTYASVSNNRNKDGTINWGTVKTPTAGSGGGYKPTVQRTVASNLQSLSNNLRNGEFGKAAVRTGNASNYKVLAMAAIESGGGDMSTHSGQAVGPMQLNTRYYKGDEVRNIDANIRKGAAEIARLDKKFGGNTDAIAIAYNGGDNAADVAYNAWLKAGKQGRVADYIPSTYVSNGKTKNYDVKQMREHAYKYDLALGYLGGSAKNRNNRGGSGGTPRATQPQSFTLGNGTLAAAQQQFTNTIRGNQLNQNAAARQSGSTVNQTGLDMYLADQKIDKNGGILNNALRDSQNVYGALIKNPAYAGLPAKDQKDILVKAIQYNKDNQGWLGSNPNKDLLNYRTNQEISNLIATRKIAYEENNYKSLRSAAQELIANESKRKGRKGRLPTIDEAMNMINPQVYASMKQKDKMVKSPFQ